MWAVSVRVLMLQGWSKTLFGQMNSQTALMQGVSAPKSFFLPLLSPLFGDLLQCASKQSSTYAALKNCLMFASQSPPAYLCVLAIASV